jgi:hypothetical protein
MRLESARSLKEELLSSFMAPIIEAASRLMARVGGGKPAGTLPLALPAQPLESAGGLHRVLALGVAPNGRGYKLAVRVQRQELMDSPLLAAIRKKARNEVDVRLIGKVAVQARRKAKARPARRAAAVPWYRKDVRPLLIGASIGHYQITAGTLGAFVRHGDVICVLSNNHVLANEDRGMKGDDILQRAAFDGGRLPAERVAALLAWQPLSRSGANYIDAALAAVAAGIEIDADRLRGIARGRDRRLKGVSEKPVDVADKVFKIGRTTGATEGRVTAFDLDNVVVGYDSANLRFDNQIEIEGAGAEPFSLGGDSGSLIVNARMEAVALLFAGSEQGGRNGLGLTYACPIDRVLHDLGATLLTT